MGLIEPKFRPAIACIAIAAAIGLLVTLLPDRTPETPTGSNSTSGSGTQSDSGHVGFFRDATAELQVDFRHDAGQTGDYFFPQIMSPGCALADFNRDGRLDLYLLNGGATPFRDADGAEADAAGHPPAVNRLYLQTSDGTFRDATRECGLDDNGYSMGVAVGDINNDGLPDLYLTNAGQDRLYLNSADGRFSEISQTAGLDNPHWSASVTFVDINVDGWLDIYVTNYVKLADKKCVSFAGTSRDYCSPSVFPAVHDRLFLNTTTKNVDGTATVSFSDISTESGISSRSSPGLGVVSGDFNQDGLPDLYVANDQTANHLWLNQGKNRFSDEAVRMGCALDSEGRAQAGMGVLMEDLNADGFQDLFVTHLDGESSAFYAGDRHGFRERSSTTGITQASLKTTGFGVAAADIDNDGDFELLVANGRVKRPERSETTDSEPPRDFWQEYRQHNQVLFNREGVFRPVLDRSNQFTQKNDVSRGLAVGDLNNDGAVDLVVANAADETRLYLNNTEYRGNWASFEIRDSRFGNRYAYGARITLNAGEHSAERYVTASSGYCSSNDPRVHFGLGQEPDIDSVEIHWPGGPTEVFQPTGINAHYLITRGDTSFADRIVRKWGEGESIP